MEISGVGAWLEAVNHSVGVLRRGRGLTLRMQGLLCDLSLGPSILGCL